MKQINKVEIRKLILEYVVKEYLEDDEEEITFDTPLISSDTLILLQWSLYLFILKENLILRSLLRKQHRRLSTA